MKTDKSEPGELSLVQQEARPPATRAPDVADMLQAVVAKGITPENAASLEKLVALYERMEDRKAEAAYNAAFVDLQRDMPRVVAQQPVPNRDGSIRYVFAPFEDIMEQVQPTLVKHGFTVSFSTRYDAGPPQRIVKICTLRHTGGHCVSNEFAVRIGSGPPGASEAQADGAAGTYCKRFALADALNIVIEKDNDARLEGGPITPQQAADLKRRVLATGSDQAAFLRFAGAANYEEISSAKYALLDESLRKKERT